MGMFKNMFTSPPASVVSNAKTRKAEKSALSFTPKNPELCAAMCEAFSKELDATTREAMNAIARSFTSGRNFAPMNYPELMYWLENDCQMPSIKKNWPKIVQWWIYNQGIHVRKESGKINSYKNYLPEGFYPIFFYDFESEMIQALKEGTATVFNPYLNILCKASEALQKVNQKMPEANPPADPPADPPAVKKSGKK